MNTNTLERLRIMRLYGMYRCFKTSLENKTNETLTCDEITALLVESEWDDRRNKSVEQRIRYAHFRYKANIEEWDFAKSRGITKNQVFRLGDCDFIRNNENLIITGATGTGKSYLASAIGYQACQLNFKVLYTNTTRLFAQLKIAKADGSEIREMQKIEKADLSILDDFGIQTLDQQSRSILMEIIEDRHGKRSTIITSQVPVKEWYDIIGEKTIADAILDRIVHNAHRIELTGESLRKKVTLEIEQKK
ncbi:MAG: IS21-like element helper ATPase IstB [Chitinophagaceae bacterium]